MHISTKGTYLMMFKRFLSDFLYKSICCGYPFELHRFVDAIQMGTHNICLYKEVDKKYAGCNLKTTELLDCALIGICAVLRSNTVNISWLETGASLYLLMCGLWKQCILSGNKESLPFHKIVYYQTVYYNFTCILNPFLPIYEESIFRGVCLSYDHFYSFFFLFHLMKTV